MGEYTMSIGGEDVAKEMRMPLGEELVAPKETPVFATPGLPVSLSANAVKTPTPEPDPFKVCTRIRAPSLW